MNQALEDAEIALNEEVRKFKLEFAELSPIMRELLSKVYIRGGMDTINKIKKSNPHLKEYEIHF